MPNFPEDWGYLFIGAASDHFICQIEGESALNAYPEFWQRKERANELIFDLLGSEACLFYIRRHGPGRQPEYEIWELTIATDQTDVPLPSQLQERQQTLQLRASVRQDGEGWLALQRIHLVDLEQGQIDAFSLPRRIHLLLDRQQNIGIPPEAFAKILTMPICADHVPTDAQIQAWEAYLRIERRTSEARQFCVPFVSHNNGTDGSRITFIIDPASATSNGSVSLTEEEFWERVQRAIRQSVKFLETSSQVGSSRSGFNLGEIDIVDRSRNHIRVQFTSDFGDFELPRQGYLFYQDVGNITQIKWKEQALRDLREGHTQNLYLGEFFFDAAQARPLLEPAQSRQDLLLPDANHSQVAAVEAVLAAEDLILLQGPPGTGKTTVIAELCYQIALRGGRVLITSQANLAVDNALSRLAHHPVLRPVREGNVGSVGEEGQPFLEDRVIDRWLQNTAADCEKRLFEQSQTVQSLRPLLTSGDRFTAYLQTEENFPSKQQQLLDRQAALELEYQAKATAHAQAEAQKREVEFLYTALEELLASNQIFLATQQQKIEQLRTRQSEINLAKTELEEWLSTANSRIYDILKQCVKQRQLFVEDLISLPSRVRSHALEVSSQPW
jgi:ABC-type branched-subunit amino acid transport system ATPase component